MAIWWLDAARYSDSDGYQADATRQNWPWRDWVINAFQSNMPFDQFTVEQFAGDLLTDATPEQILATCFHRNHMTNGEGGRDPAESRVHDVIDRVNTTGTVWLGLTLGCAQCHSHKFDPISQSDFYSMAAFFNSIDEDGRAGMNANPCLRYQSSAVREMRRGHPLLTSLLAHGTMARKSHLVLGLGSSSMARVNRREVLADEEIQVVDDFFGTTHCRVIHHPIRSQFVCGACIAV